MQNDTNLINDAIAEARTLRKLSMSNCRHSLVKFLKEEKLPLDDLADAELDLHAFVDLLLKKNRERAKEDELNPQGLPYLNNKYIFSKHNNDDELDEHGRFKMYGDVDDVEFEYGDDIMDSEEEADDTEDEENFSDKAIEERNRKWKNLYGRRNFKSSPAIVSSGTGTTKLSQNERNLLLKHAGLLKENKENRQSKATKDDLIRERAGINKSNKHLAKRVVRDIAIKKKLK